MSVTLLKSLAWLLLLSGGKSLHKRRVSRSRRGVSRFGTKSSRNGGGGLATNELEILKISQ